MIQEIAKDMTIAFTYKGGRKVRGLVLVVGKTDVCIRLHTDYIGKNEMWEAGESKLFNLKEMKRVSIIKPPSSNS